MQEREYDMPPETICKTVRQYSSGRIPEQDMKKLQEISEDYRKVKNYVYARYGGKQSLSKLYPGYTVQNEMTKSGLRIDLNLPAVYFYLAVFDALGDIKSQWTRTKAKILKLVKLNDHLSEEEKHYIRFVLKISNAFEAVLNQKPIRLPCKMQENYDRIAVQVDREKLHRYLCRQARKYYVKQHTDKTAGFAIAERAYRYGDHGIYISTKEKRKRVFVPLTDNNKYKNQLYIKLYPEENRIEIKVPVYVAVRIHEDYKNQVGLAVGMFTMLTTDTGHSYGRELGKYQMTYAEWLRKQTKEYNHNRAEKQGSKKYHAKKKRYEEQMHSYINHELNRFLKTEQPKTVYIVKLPKPKMGGVNKKINYSVSMWQRGYIRNRLTQKCKEQSIELVEVLGKNISSECSCCGASGYKKDGNFFCEACGYHAEEKTNTAQNVLKRGKAGKIVR